MSELIQSDILDALLTEPARLPHALLFTGPRGIGKRDLAEALAARLLCEASLPPGAPACGRCASCRLLESGNHPDFRALEPESGDSEEGASVEGSEAGKKKGEPQIRIAQLRELESFFHVGGHRAGARVCLIEPAEAMNAATANALLKILEEPSASFYFFIVSHQWHRLLPTLVSRCRRIVCPRPDERQARRWLETQSGAMTAHRLAFFAYAPKALLEAERRGQLALLDRLLEGLGRAEAPLSLAAQWETWVKSEHGPSLDEITATVQKWLSDRLRESVDAPTRFATAGARMRTPVPLTSWIEAYRQVTRLRAWARHPLNPRLYLEALLIHALSPLTR